MSILRSDRNFYDYHISDIVLFNLKERLSYGLLELGAYTVVDEDESSTYRTLNKVHDRSLGGTGKVYEGVGASWVWQDDVTVPSGYPAIFQPSGVYVNSVFYPTASTSGTYAHYIDYRNGRVIFNSAVTSGTVECNYVANDVAFYMHDEKEWKTFISLADQNYSEIGSISPSGIASVLKSHRVHLPCVFLETVNKDHEALQLGGGEQSVFEIRYHILADNPFLRKTIGDIIDDQIQKVFPIYDIKDAPFPLDYKGRINDDALTYLELADSSSPYFMDKAMIVSSSVNYTTRINDLYIGRVRQKLKMDRYGF